MFKKLRLLLGLSLVSVIMLGIPAYAAGQAKPPVTDLGPEVSATVTGILSQGSMPSGLFDGTTVNEWNTPKIAYWLHDTEYVELNIDDDCNIWRSGTDGWSYQNAPLTIKKLVGGEFVDVTNQIPQSISKIGNTKWEKTISNLPKGVYRFYGPSSLGRIDSEWYLEGVNKNIGKETITIETPKSSVSVGELFTTDVVLHNAQTICAEDFKVKYDSTLFEYVGYEEVTGLKVYKDIVTSDTLRFIVASKGKSFAINGEGTLIKLKFKAKKSGKGLVDSTAGRIADNGTMEKDIETTLCGEREITVKSVMDVNRTGTFTLLDLGIDAWYNGDSSSNTDSSKYDADVVIDGSINDLDLTAIVQEIINNPNYTPNN